VSDLGAERESIFVDLAGASVSGLGFDLESLILLTMISRTAMLGCFGLSPSAALDFRLQLLWTFAFSCFGLSPSTLAGIAAPRWLQDR
jgi:hypothetical protein